MLLSKTCAYAIRATIYLAIQKEKQFVPIKEIAETLNLSFHFLTKIFQTLTKADFLESVKGPKGGVSLKKQPSETTIFDVIQIIDGKDIFNECVLDLPGCSDETPCPMHNTWGQLRKDLNKMLKTKTLESLALQVRNKSILLYE